MSTAPRLFVNGYDVGGVNYGEWQRYANDDTSASITVSGVDFNEVMLDVGAASGTSTVRLSLIFAKGYATRKRSGFVTSSENRQMMDIVYDGTNEFTIQFYEVHPGGSWGQVTSYANVYYR